ncbi:MAG: hypothetical protein ACREBY_12145, partial [Polaromonas sp.]
VPYDLIFHDVVNAIEDKMNKLTTQDTDYGLYAGQGFEGQSSDDMVMPFLTILQALSPQVQEGPLRPGMLLDTVTGETWDGKSGIPFVPATTQHKFVEWRPRDSGGGFVGHLSPTDPIVEECRRTQEFGKWHTVGGNDLVETFYVYGILATETPRQQVIAFSGARIKKYRAWMTKARTVQVPSGNNRMNIAPLFAHRYRLRTILEKNPKGTYYNWDTIDFDGGDQVFARLSHVDPLFQAAAALRNVVISGQANVNYEMPESEPVSTGSPMDDSSTTANKTALPHADITITNTLPPFQNMIMEKNWDKWQAQIRGGKTLEALLKFLESRYSLTIAQKQELGHLVDVHGLRDEESYEIY